MKSYRKIDDTRFLLPLSGFIHLSQFNFLLAMVLIVLAVFSFHSSSIGFIYAIFFTFFLPGFVFVNIFFRNLESVEKLVLILFLSVLFSTQLVYWLSMIIGYSKISIVLTGLIFLPLIFFSRAPRTDFNLFKNPAILLSIGIFLIFYIVLSSSIWVSRGEDILLSGSNWQDTPMHLGIIESLNQGNFPPQMPYYSGERMTYHYFVDLHTAIIEKMSDMFNPRLLVYLNSFFAALFALSVFVLANYITRSHISSIFAAVIGVFGGGFNYIRFFQAFFDQNWVHLSDLFEQSYVLEWKQFFQIVPIFEVLLQARPQLMGLPGLVIAAYFLWRGFDEKAPGKVLLSGLITGLLFPFNITAFLAMGMIFAFTLIHQTYHKKFRIKGCTLFLIPLLTSIPFILAIDTASTPGISMNPGWSAPDKTFYGLTIFYLGNFGMPFILSLLFIYKLEKNAYFIYSWLLGMFLLPNLITFTPEPYDMYKFFSFMWIPVAIASGNILGRLYNRKKYVIVLILILLSVLTPFLDAAWNLSVKYPGYTIPEYQAGIWVRENTEPMSVFLEHSGIHSPPSQIGGRLQIMGYGTWAYGHGFNIWIRDSDIERAFKGSREEILEIAAKYNATYAYIGKEELRLYPDVKEKFDRNFTIAYSDEIGKIWIYRIL